MLLGRILSWAILLMALLAGSTELSVRADTGNYQMLSFGNLWTDIHPGTFASIKIWVEREEFLGTPWLWDPLLIIIFNLPAWPTLLIIGAFLQLFFRNRKL